MSIQGRMKKRAKLTCALTVERQSLLVFATLSPHAKVGVLISYVVSSHGAQRLKAAGGSVCLPGTGEGPRQRVPFRSPQEVSHSAFSWKLK